MIDVDESQSGSSTPSHKRKREGKKKKAKKPKSQPPPKLIVTPDHISTRLEIKNLQDLIVYTLGNHQAPTWCGLQGRSQIKNVVTVQVPGLTPLMFGFDTTKVKPTEVKGPSQLSVLKNNFDLVWPTAAPGNKKQLFSPQGALVHVPLTKSERREVQASSKERKKLEIDDLLLNVDDLVQNNYPLHPDVDITGTNYKAEKNEGLVYTVDLESERKVVAIDCEMCETKEGKELTRITVLKVDEAHEHGTVMYDKLVKPHNEIIDYLTQWSGITQEMLQDVTLRLEDVQKDLLESISSKDIIIGHSLDCDLAVLKLAHPRIVDTAICFQHPRGVTYKPSLKWLSQKFLNMNIQASVHGHDSAEDARACAYLVKAKLAKGSTFGMNKVRTMDIASKLKECGHTTAIIDYGVPHWHNESAKTVISCSDDDEIVKHVCKAAQNHSYVYTRLLELENAQCWKDPGKLPVIGQVEDALVRLNERLEAIFASLPEYTLLIVWSGTGDISKVTELKQKQQNYQKLFQTKLLSEIDKADLWTATDVHMLEIAMLDSRKGVSLTTIKQPDTAVENGSYEIDDEADDDNDDDDDYTNKTSLRKRSKPNSEESDHSSSSE